MHSAWAEGTVKAPERTGRNSISAFHEHSIGTGSDTDAMAYIQITLEDGKKFWGCGKSSNIGRAGIRAVVSAINQIA